MLDSIIQYLLLTFPVLYPVMVKIVMIVGTMRLFMKPLFTFVGEVVLLTPSNRDDLFLAKVMASKAYKVLTFVLDYIASIKLPQLKK